MTTENWNNFQQKYTNYYDGRSISPMLFEFPSFQFDKHYCSSQHTPFNYYCQMLSKLRNLLVFDSQWKQRPACNLLEIKKREFLSGFDFEW